MGEKLAQTNKTKTPTRAVIELRNYENGSEFRKSAQKHSENAQKVKNAIIIPPLDVEKPVEQTAPKRDELPEGAGPEGEAAVLRLDNEDLEAPVDNGQNRIIER